MRSSMVTGLRLSAVTSVLVGDRREGRDMGGGHARTEAEVGVVWPQAKEPMEPPDAGEGRKGSPQSPQGARPC